MYQTVRQRQLRTDQQTREQFFNMVQIEANNFHNACLHWLETGTCQSYQCGTDLKEGGSFRSHIIDHPVVFKEQNNNKDPKNRRRCIVLQPYASLHEAKVFFGPLLQRFKIEFFKVSWYPAKTIHIELWNNINPDNSLVRSTFKDEMKLLKRKNSQFSDIDFSNLNMVADAINQNIANSK